VPAAIPRHDASETPETIAGTLETAGAVIVENLLDPALLARLNAEIDPLLEEARPDRPFLNPVIEWFFGKQTRHVTAVAARSRTFSHEILPHPVYMAICDRILGPACSSYQLNIAHIMDRGPGAEQQLLHRDEDVWPHLPRPHPEIQLASVIALVDFRADIGATRVVPGSHRWPREREPRPEEIAVAEMKAGSAVVYLGSAIHAGGANVSRGEFRRGMHVSYTVGWLRTEENQYLSVPIEEVRAMPRRSQELLGYAAHDAIAAGGGYLGTVDLVSPVDLIADGRL
jgi:ectoine hydroxylase-related dioxygenase (phytanoyl-CoA dioxygenase family)